MREEIAIGRLGSVACSLPSSLASMVDLIDEFRPEQPRRVRLRVCAAAIGVACSLDGAPVYSPIRSDLLEYGARMLDHLLRQGVTLSQIAESGSYLISDYVDELPKEAEVQAAADFIEAAAAAS